MVAFDKFVVDFVAWATHAGSCWVATLDHEARNDAVENYAVVESLLNEFFEVAGRDGHVVIKFNRDVSFVGF